MTDLSKLFTCPLCQKPNFTKSGLRAHQCKKRATATSKSGPLDQDECQAVIEGRWPEFTRERAAAAQLPEPAESGNAGSAGRRVVPPGHREIKTIEDLELLPPPRRPAKPGAPMPLVEIEEHLARIDGRINETTRDYQNQVIYDIVGKGLMLLKAEAHYLVGHLPATVAGKSHKRNKKGELQAQEGFTKWLEGRGMSERSARNYRNAARNCGLTSDHTLDDVEALRQALALHEKKPTDLYRLADAAKTPPPEPPAVVNLVADVFAATCTTLDELRSVRDEMKSDEYETAWLYLKSALEDFTGAEWVMTERKPGIDATEHGQVTAVNGHKKAPKARKKGARK